MVLPPKIRFLQISQPRDTRYHPPNYQFVSGNSISLFLSLSLSLSLYRHQVTLSQLCRVARRKQAQLASFQSASTMEKYQEISHEPE